MNAQFQVELKDAETIVFLGDSITEQNLYAAFLETFLLSRFPKKNLTFYNFGWGGDTSVGGGARFARDVAPVKPSLVFVNFGMNDGGYVPFDQKIFDRHAQGQRELAAKIKACGARQVLLTTSCIDYDKTPLKDVYNGTLERYATAMLALAAELGLPAADIFHPMRQLQREAKAARPGFCMIPDSVHPDPVGHLVMAYFVLKQIAAPKPLGAIEITGGKLRRREGVKVGAFSASDAGYAFDLALPHLPFYVPPEARPALEFLPAQQEWNSLVLKVAGWDPRQSAQLAVNGKPCGIFSAERLAQGVDLSVLDGAPWTEQGRLLWDAAQLRFRKHFDLWRPLGLEAPSFLAEMPAAKRLVAAQTKLVADLLRLKKKLLRPGKYHVTVAPSNQPVIERLEISPMYPYQAHEFERAFPPELEPEKVVWTKAALVNGVVDLGRHFNGALNCVSYARVYLEAEAACALHLDIGSDDGITLWVNGRKVLARDVQRGMNIGDDRVDVELRPGRNELLFRVTQFLGGYFLGFRASVPGPVRVWQI